MVEDTITDDDCCETDETSHREREKYKAGFFDIEIVDCSEYVGEGSEECEEHREVEGCVEGEKNDNRFGGKHVEWSCERDGEKEFDLFCGWRTWWDGDVETFCAAEEDLFLVGFFGKKCKDYGEDGEEDDGPLCPLPVLTYGDEGTYYGSANG